jgi:hypothetical protein
MEKLRQLSRRHPLRTIYAIGIVSAVLLWGITVLTANNPSDIGPEPSTPTTVEVAENDDTGNEPEVAGDVDAPAEKPTDGKAAAATPDRTLSASTNTGPTTTRQSAPSSQPAQQNTQPSTRQTSEPTPQQRSPEKPEKRPEPEPEPEPQPSLICVLGLICL